MDIHYEITGKGAETLMFVPGLGLPVQAFSMVAPAFAGGYRILLVDPRGAGLSSAPDEPYGPGQVTGDMLAVLDHADVD